MKIHEYQAKELLARAGVAVPAGEATDSAAGALEAADRLGRLPLAVKAQILAGGRGKAGGIRIARTADEVTAAAQALLGMTLVTPQTGPAGRRVTKILVEEGIVADRELYLGLLVDRKAAGFAFLASSAGGMDIETVAAQSPQKIARAAIDPLAGLQTFHCRELAYGLGLPGPLHPGFFSLCEALYAFFTEHDCQLLEINPLAVTADGRLLALDAKVEIDDNALFRHPDLALLRDLEETTAREREAAAAGLSYVELAGTVGTMVNGAGLAMATLDLIARAGATPANFLDVGGGASAEAVASGLRLILGDPRVRAVFINIFGGILRCDLLAAGVVEAARQVGLRVPVVVRMAGTNAAEGLAILAASGLALTTAADLEEAAEKIAALAPHLRERP